MKQVLKDVSDGNLNEVKVHILTYMLYKFGGGKKWNRLDYNVVILKYLRQPQYEGYATTWKILKSSMFRAKALRPFVSDSIVQSIQRNATQRDTTQHNTTQHNTTQHNTTQHTIQY
jgi:hypothetical protein